MRKFSGTDLTSHILPKVSHASGCHLSGTTGKQYIDGSGGPALFSPGRAHPAVNAAIEEQLARIAHGYRFFFTSDARERLTELIQTQAGAGFEHVIFVSSGSEATESALKVVLQ